MRDSDSIEQKKLESYRGYLIYLARTYPMITPYLKGIHLMLDSWRPWRKDDGWKMSLSEIRRALQEKGVDEAVSSRSGGKAPPNVKWIPRLVEDIQALKHLFHPLNPPKRLVRPSMNAEVRCFGKWLRFYLPIEWRIALFQWTMASKCV